MQRGFHVSREPHFSRLIEVIRSALPQLRQTPSGKRIALKLIKRYPVLGYTPSPYITPSAIDMQQMHQTLAGLGPADDHGHQSFSCFGLPGPFSMGRSKNLSSDFSSSRVYPGAFCSDLPTQLIPSHDCGHLDRPFQHLGIPVPLPGVVLNSPTLRAMQEFSRLQQGSANGQSSPLIRPPRI